MLLLGLLVLGAVVVATQTEFGRERIRQLVVGQLAGAMKGRGTLYVGRISGSFIAGLTIDSLELRDSEDSLFVAAGAVRVRYDVRDILDKRILLSHLEVERPVVNLRRHVERDWNYERIFKSGASKPAPVRPTIPGVRERGLGDFIVIDSAVIRGGTFVLTEPWSPPDSLVGARRDSAVRVALASTEHEIRRTGEGLKQTRRWNRIELRSPHVRIADPDSAGMLFIVGRLDVEESDPPFTFRNVRGPVRVLGDSVWFDIAHFELPGSTGSGQGKVWWGSDLPIRWDVAVTGDSVSLADIAWVHSTLPRTGGGSMRLTIRNDPRDLRVVNFAIREMDVRTTRSRLRGAMTFGVGGPVLEVKDVALEADPLNFDLLRTLNGGPFPVDWQGNITGQVRGAGGPLHRFRVDDARLAFRDAHVRGAMSVLSARGGIDILEPADAKFRALNVNVSTLDLRSIRHLFPDFPRLNGIIRGTAMLDSSWQDVRFRNADVEHHDGPDVPTRVTGAGRITLGEKYVSFDTEIEAHPLSFTTLARSYPGLQFRGPYSGPLRVKGTIADMELAASLTGQGGEMSVDGRFGLEPHAMSARATGSVGELDPRVLLERGDLLPMRLNGRFDADLRGDSLPTLDGALSIELERSRVDSLLVNHSLATLAFGDGRMRVDSLDLSLSAGRVRASGALGLTPSVSDTLRYSVVVDSLGGLRPYLSQPPSQRVALAQATLDGGGSPEDKKVQAIRDSLHGRIESDGVLVGSLDTLAVLGTIAGRDLFAGGDRARRVRGTYSFAGVPLAPSGVLRIAVDSAIVSGVHMDTVSASLALNDRSSGRVEVGATSGSDRGRFRGAALLGFERTRDATRVALDSAGITVREHTWSLAAPTRIVVDSSGATVDSLVLRNGGGSLALWGNFPFHAPVDGTLEIDSMPLADLGELLQTAERLDGTATFALRVTGMRHDPFIRMNGYFTALRYGELRFPYFTARGDFANRRLATAFEVFRNGAPTLTATAAIPMDLSLARVPERILDEPLSGNIRADSVDLALLEALTPKVTRVTGSASTSIDLGGTWRRPTFAGRLLVRRGAMLLPNGGVTLRDVEADITFTPDSVKIGRLSARSGSQSNSMASLTGALSVPNYRDRRTYGFGLAMRATNFQAINKRSLARLELSGSLNLTGSFGQPVLGGNVTIDRGAIFISDLSQKQVINLNDSELYDLVDTSLVANRGLIEALPPDLDSALANLRVPSLQVHIGEDVWLRSREANIKLAGEMELAKLGNQRLERGTLRVSRGTYRLDLGVVQRTFQVDSGSVSFYGDPRIPAELDIDASYIVRQASRDAGQDLRIVAHIGGTIAQPQLSFRTEERIPLSNTEILSFLVFGQPSFIAANDPVNTAVLRSVAAALLPSVGAVLERALTSQIGFIDLVQVQTGSVGGRDGLATDAPDSRSVLAGTRIGVGKQVGERTFITANAGLCEIASGRQSGAATSGASFYNSLGITVEHRVKGGYSLQASVEPSQAALQCRPGAAETTRRPQQIGFDLFGEWHF
jgi:translocation and assembly module TamB